MTNEFIKINIPGRRNDDVIKFYLSLQNSSQQVKMVDLEHHSKCIDFTGPVIFLIIYKQSNMN